MIYLPINYDSYRNDLEAVHKKAKYHKLFEDDGMIIIPMYKGQLDVEHHATHDIYTYELNDEYKGFNELELALLDCDLAAAFGNFTLNEDKTVTIKVFNE